MNNKVCKQRAALAADLHFKHSMHESKRANLRRLAPIHGLQTGL